MRGGNRIIKFSYNHTQRNFQYVKDEIVIDIVLKKIEEVSNQSEKERNFVLEGFPKTRVQGLAL